MATIDIGNPAIDRSTYCNLENTFVDKGNPANGSGSITSIEIWLTQDGTGVEVATFEEVDTDTFTTRDSETLGSVTGGSKQTFSGLDMDVVAGDYIGAHATSAYLEHHTSGYDGTWYGIGDQIPCTNQSFTFLSGDASSLYGEGETAGATEKSSSDTGAGADAKASGNPIATLVKAETGSGSDILSQVQAILDGAETGSGVDAVDSLETPEAKSSSDAGSGVEGTPVQNAILVGSESGSGIEGTPAQNAILVGSESGSGIEALIARLLTGDESGAAVEAADVEVDGLLKDLFASELGEGSDRLTAKIEMPTKGGGMKLWT